MSGPPPSTRRDRGRAARPRARSARGPLLFAGVAGVALVLLVAAARPLAGDPVGAFASFAQDKDSLLRQAAVRSLIAERMGPEAELPVDPGGAARPFIVRRGETARSVAGNLEQAGLVRSALAFTLVLYDAGREGAIQAGTYALSPAMTPREIAKALERAPGEQVTLKIIEGWRRSEIAAAVAQAFPGITAEAFLAASVVGGRTDPFLEGLEAATPLEGFLFPDTYFFRPSATAKEIVDALVGTFAERAGPLLAAARERGAKAYDVVRLASIVEREARNPAESPMIAGVYANRLRLGMKLDADPTIQYALGDWRVLLLRDLETDSPYNTYRVAGLPPTPICSPGRAALEAAAKPGEVPYLYFVAKEDGTGGHAFATTLEEQEANRVRYGNR